jgi:hypothetical protein
MDKPTRKLKRLSNAAKAAIVFPDQIKEVITGMMLGDSCLSLPKDCKNAPCGSAKKIRISFACSEVGSISFFRDFRWQTLLPGCGLTQRAGGPDPTGWTAPPSRLNSTPLNSTQLNSTPEGGCRRSWPTASGDGAC